MERGILHIFSYYVHFIRFLHFCISRVNVGKFDRHEEVKLKCEIPREKKYSKLSNNVLTSLKVKKFCEMCERIVYSSCRQ